MADIAQIGFAANTTQLKAAEADLKALTPAAKSVEQAAKEVEAALSKVAKAAQGVSTSTTNANKTIAASNDNLKRQTSTTTAATKATDEYFRKLDKARESTGRMSFEAKNLSYQLVDVTQGLASGQPVFQIFAQQAGQIAQVIATSPGGLTGLMRELGTAIKGILTPMRLAALGGTALAGGLLIGLASTVNSIKEFDSLAQSLDMVTPKLRALQQLASGKGISNESFATGMKGFADEVYNAQRNMGSLNGLMIANGKQAKTNADYFSNVADLVQRATSNMQKQKILEAAGLPITQEWVRFMSQGGAAIRAAAAGTVGFNNAAEQNLIRKAKEFDEAWNTATTKMVNYFKAGMIEIAGAMSNVTIPDWLKNAGKIASAGILAPIAAAKLAMQGDAATSFKDRFGNFSTPNADLGAGLQNKANKANGVSQPKTQGELLNENAQAQQKISLLGEMATVNDRVRQTELQLAAAGLQGIGVTTKQREAILNSVRAQEEMNRVNQQAQIGIFNVTQANKAAADTLQMWIDKGLVDKTNTEQMAAAKLTLARNIDQVKNSAQIAAAPLQQLKQLELDGANFGKQLDGTLTSSLNNLVGPIQDVMNGVTSMGDGFKNAGVIILKAIQEMIIKMLIITPIAKALQAALSGITGGGGAGGGIASAITSLFSAKGNVFENNNVKKFANGGTFTNSVVTKPTMFGYGGKFGMMGEAGAEAVMPLKRGPNGSLGVQMYGQTANDNRSQSIVYAPQYTLGGSATAEDLANLRREQARDRAAFGSKVIEVTQQARKRNVRGI